MTLLTILLHDASFLNNMNDVSARFHYYTEDKLALARLRNNQSESLQGECADDITTVLLLTLANVLRNWLLVLFTEQPNVS